MDRSGTEHYVEELYFLITKFLETGPCKQSLQKLKEEIVEHKIIPKRLDWEGNEHEQTFEELESKYPHIAPQHLLEVCKRIGPILDKEILPCAPGVRTLLGAGSQSLLRNRDVIKKHLRLPEFIVRHHGRSIYSPITCHNHNIVQVLYGQEISGPACRKHIFGPRFYYRTRLLNRTLGHLTAVYCLLFDQTGKFVITGADDLLVKVWSAVDGRLLCTLRGASAEITDIAINIENTLLAAGSLDKAVRVWCLQSAYPVATLSAHTGMITGVNFCPNPFGGNHYLVSTSTDGSVAFWSYSMDPVVFQPKPILYNEKIRPGQAQMICSSFSYGGAFLATGSADHHVRVYSMSTNPPQRIMEMEKHSDRVDSLLWANRGLKFISGSKDGTAIIWHYRAQMWHTKILDMTTALPGSNQKQDDSKVKLKVTMVCWSSDDSLIITAVNNFTIKIWSPMGKLLRELTAHKDVVYVLEFHPLDSSILLSAGHDGIVFLWDLRNGEQLFMHQNYIEGQGNGAIFDAKWSPDGTMMAATDSHGHILMFGIAQYNNKMESLPKELFFHTDYRPLVRSSENQVLDEQTQTPPHLMPPPFLVDIDGNPYPPPLQRLVPGREQCTVDQLIPHIIYTPGGQPEVVQFEVEVRLSIDQRIEELVQQGNAMETSSPRNETSPRSRLVRLNEVEGRRGPPPTNNQLQHFSWKKRTLVSQLSPGTLSTIRSRINFFGNLELEEYETERNREVECIAEIPSILSKKPKKKLLHNYRTRATRNSDGVQPEGEDGSEGTGLTEGNSSEASVLSESSESSSSESSSSEYSDWVAEHSVNLEPPQRSRRQRKRKPPEAAVPSTPEPPPAVPVPGPSTASQPEPRPSTSHAPRPSKKPPIPPLDEIKEVPELYRPSEWLSEVIPKKFPYYPQMGDEVMFFTQGYELYLKAVSDRKVYELAKSQLRPWGNLELQEPELVKVIGIKYELRPPRLCCLRLAVMKENGSLTGERFTIKYHDVPDVIDFFVLKQTYDTAMMRNWKIGDRFRSMIDDGWWWGVIESRRPNANSPFLCHRIRWDNGEAEDMSPWDMEPIDPTREPEHGGSVPVLPEEIASILYHPRADEWPGGDRESYCERTISGLEEVMGLSIAEPFTAPVDINVYKSYAFVVEFPIDLSTIKARLENRFYRRLTAAQFDIRYLATNAEKFNESHSVIVKNARIVTDLCLKICKGDEYVDVSQLYRQLVENYESSNSEEEGDLSGRERAAANRSLRALRRANHLHPDWRRDCRQLLEVLWSCHDSEPFRGPVDRIEHPDYHKVVATPIDLGQIREELKGNNYDSPIEFCKDIRLLFSNSRQYNTNKRSKIYVMTVRLAAMAEEHMRRIIKDWKVACRKQNKTKMNGLRKTRQKRAVSQDDSGGSIDTENSDSSSDEQDNPPSHSQVPITSTDRPKRVKVLLPKVSGNTASNTSNNLFNNSNNQGKYKTRSANGIRKSVRYELSNNEDSNDQVRPVRLRLPIMKKLNHFVSTSETDSSSQLYASSSSAHRSLRATKAVSYAEIAGEESSHSSNEGQHQNKIQPYNMRSSRSLQKSRSIPSKANYNENSSSGSETNLPRSKNNEESGSGSGESGSSSGSDLEAVEEGGGEKTQGLVIHVNGGLGAAQGSSSPSTSASAPPHTRTPPPNQPNQHRFVENNAESTESESDVEEEEEDEEEEEFYKKSQRRPKRWNTSKRKEDSEGALGANSRTGVGLRARKKPSWLDKDYEGESEEENNLPSRKARARRKYEEDEESDRRVQPSRRQSTSNRLSWPEDDDEEEVLPTRNSRAQRRPSWNAESGTANKSKAASPTRPRQNSTRKPSWMEAQEESGESLDHVPPHTRPRRSVARKRKKSSSSDSSDTYRPRRSERARRPLKRQNYAYESDSEGRLAGGGASSSSSEGAEERPRISISSRGRVRKITPRARAYLLD